MRRMLTQNLGWKLLSVALAFALWAAIGRDPETGTSVVARVQYKNLAGDLDISSAIPANVSLELRGSSRRLQESNLSAVGVILDFAHVQGPGEQTFNITASNTNLPFGVSFSRAIPAQLRLRFDRILTRDVPVEARYTGAPAPGYELLRGELQPSVVRVRGPESRVAEVVNAQTDPIDLTGIVGERAGQVHVWTGDPQVHLTDRGTIAYKVTVKKIVQKDLHR